ncbi:hypothetical protein SALBM311S_05769 [Streptomyces alboniger]
MAVRRARPQLRPYDDPNWRSPSGTPWTSSTTSAASRPGAPTSPDCCSPSAADPWPGRRWPGSPHGTSSGETTWFGLAREVFRLLGTDPDRVHPTTSEAFIRPAPRPAYSVLGHDRFRAAGIEPLRDWRAALTEAFPEIHRAHTKENPA